MNERRVLRLGGLHPSTTLQRGGARLDEVGGLWGAQSEAAGERLGVAAHAKAGTRSNVNQLVSDIRSSITAIPYEPCRRPRGAKEGSSTSADRRNVKREGKN
jgi:hypothetical protein